MSKLSDFVECVDESTKDGRATLKCKLGLWSVSAADSNSVYLEAFHYWQQYNDDGEYSSILGGESVNDKLLNGRAK